MRKYGSHRLTAFISTLAMIAACGGDATVTDPTIVPPELRLKDVTLEPFTGAFYHFEYDGDGRISGASYREGLDVYTVEYAGGRMKRMRNSSDTGLDYIEYTYDLAGRVDDVKYVTRPSATTGVEYSYTYTGGKLTGVERRRIISTGTSIGMRIDKTLTLTYHADGNLDTLTEHWLPIQDVQREVIRVTRFEAYDAGTSVDGFARILADDWDRLIVLPGVQIQKNNPRRQIRSYDGMTDSTEFTYQYDTDGKRPLTKTGDRVITSGTGVGEHLQTSTVFSYW